MLSLNVLVFLILGCCAGLLAGLFGVGGGLIVVAALAFLAPALGVPDAHIMHVALATALTGIVFTSASSGYAHAKRRAVLWPSVVDLLPGLLIGAACGAWLASRADSTHLQIGVGLFCLVAAIQMWRPMPTRTNASPPHSSHNDANHLDPNETPRGTVVRVAGFVIGTLAAMVGIGGGSLTVPFLIHRHAEPVRAVATSAVCGFPIALSSAIAYAFAGRGVEGLPSGTWGFVYLPAAISIAIASVITAPLGARLAHHIGGLALKRAFAIFLVFIAGVLLAESTAKWHSSF